MKARVARFYGWTDREIESMDAINFNSYFKAIIPIECHEQVQGINISMFPNMKKEDRKNFFNRLKRTVRESIKREAQVKSYGDVVANLKEQLRGR